MKHFFVTGLPRSRTAWMAVWLTSGQSFCWHDASRGPDLLDKLLQRPEEYVGDSDSGLLWLWRQVQENFSDAPWVLVRRHGFAARVSYEKHFAEFDYPGAPTGEAREAVWQRAEHEVARIEAHAKNLLVVEFTDLDDEPAAREIWGHCIPTIPFDRERWQHLNSLRVNVRPEKL